MLHIGPLRPTHNQNVDRNRLARIRRQARKRGLRVLKDWTGGWNLVDAHVEPPRALVGLEHTSLEVIETVIATPLPPARPRSQKRPAVERLTPQASHPAASSFTGLVEQLMKGGVS
jgi:hypothetical protein